MPVRKKPGQPETPVSLPETNVLDTEKETKQVAEPEVTVEGGTANNSAATEEQEVEEGPFVYLCEPTEHNYQVMVRGEEKSANGRLVRYDRALFCTQCGDCREAFTREEMAVMYAQTEEQSGTVQ